MLSLTRGDTLPVRNAPCHGREPAQKVLLVYPPISKMERYGSELGIFGGKQIPLGVFCLAAYLRQRGYPVHALDAEARELTNEQVVAELRAARTRCWGSPRRRSPSTGR